MPVKSSTQKISPARQQTGELDVQINFIEGVVRREPSYVEALQLLGDTYTKRGRFSEGLGVDRAAGATRTWKSAGILQLGVQLLAHGPV